MGQSCSISWYSEFILFQLFESNITLLRSLTARELRASENTRAVMAREKS